MEPIYHGEYRGRPTLRNDRQQLVRYMRELNLARTASRREEAGRQWADEEDGLVEAITQSIESSEEDEAFELAIAMSRSLREDEPETVAPLDFSRLFNQPQISASQNTYGGDSPQTIPIGTSNVPGLPEMYKNYRFIPTMFSDNHMWSLAAIRQQHAELSVPRASEAVTEWTEGQPESRRCVVCYTNVATRMAVPCGHLVGCRTCCEDMLKKPHYYYVTAGGGEIEQISDIQIPLQCFICRAIIGLVIAPHC